MRANHVALKKSQTAVFGGSGTNCHVHTDPYRITHTRIQNPIQSLDRENSKCIGSLHFWVCGICTHSKNTSRKLDLKSTKTIFVGCCTNTKAYRLWNIQRRRRIISCDVIFDECSISGTRTPKIFSGLFSFQQTPTAPQGEITADPIHHGKTTAFHVSEGKTDPNSNNEQHGRE